MLQKYCTLKVRPLLLRGRWRRSFASKGGQWVTHKIDEVILCSSTIIGLGLLVVVVKIFEC